MNKIEAWLGGLFHKNHEPFWGPSFSFGLLMAIANIVGPLWLAGLVATNSVLDRQFAFWCVVVLLVVGASLVLRLRGYQRLSALVISLQFLPPIWLLMTLALAN